MISRRQLLLGGLGTFGALTALLGLRVASSRPEDVIVALLRRRLDYLQLDEAGLQAFAVDYVASGKSAAAKLRGMAVIGPLYFQVTNQTWAPRSLRRSEERVATAYLLASDFFTNGADEHLPVRYRGLFDPWANNLACRNPFASHARDAA